MRFFGRKLAFTGCAAVLLLTLAAGSRADDGEDSVFCAWAQQVVADTNLAANVVTQTTYDNFVSSKASDSPLTVQQYWSNPAPGTDKLMRVVSCKMKTAERINTAYPPKVESDVATAQGDQSCDMINREVLVNVLNGIPREDLSVPVNTLQVDKEEVTFIGPMWLKPWPFEPLYRDDEGVLHIRSKALYVPFSWWIPMPDRFKGTYYCHLIAPDYLEAVLLGAVDPGV